MSARESAAWQDPWGSGPLPPGVYERMVDGDLRAVLAAVEGEKLRAEIAEVSEADLPQVLSHHLRQRIERELERLPKQERLGFANRLLAEIARADAGQLLEGRGQLLEGRGRLLKQVREGDRGPLPRPSTPLVDVALLTNGPADPTLQSELRLEMVSADRVDLLCAFIKFSGLRLLRESLADLRRRGVPLRVLTTTYMGATDRKALDLLVQEFGAQVRVSYAVQSTRLHAKAWMFHRRTGFHTGYVGSSNLSGAALVDGVEWNVRISQAGTRTLMEKFEATFETYWNDESFEPYDPQKDAQRFDAALAASAGYGRAAAGPAPAPAAEGSAEGEGSGADGSGLDASGVDASGVPRGSGLLPVGAGIQPMSFQRTMLEDLRSEREVHGRNRNLLVAATGTGKTVMAALDYRDLAGDRRPRPRLLFVAHRKEILQQALSTYRDVLGDGAFGELLVDGQRPEAWEHVFASVQSVSGEELLRRLGPEHFEIVVIDEFHHAHAESYRRILDLLRPRQLLGLTATPERADGVSVVDEFFGGRIASQIRLWDALEKDLLVPFHYFGIADNVDLSRVRFHRGEYRLDDLAKILDHNAARALKVYQAVQEQIMEPHRMRALGFCVSVDHARFMAQEFRRAGLRAEYLSGDSSSEWRQKCLEDLRAGRICVIFAVDLFNEGLDIPEIDTVLLLRPTQSATIFLQQIGRGLRRSPGKSVLTILDFVGLQNQSFRFEEKLHALTGLSRGRIASGVERGFPYLPSGSQIILDRVTQRQVLENVRSQISPSTRQLVQEVAQLSAGERRVRLRLKEFLDDSGRIMEDVYGPVTRTYNGEQRPATWTALADWGVPEEVWSAAYEDEKDMLRRIGNLAHVDDLDRIRAYRRLLDPSLTPEQRAADPFAPMLAFTFWMNGPAGGLAAGLQRLAESTATREEILQVLEVREAEIHTVAERLPGRLKDSPLRSHAHYSREELTAAFGLGTTVKGTPGSFLSGVRWFPEAQTDLLLVTLTKPEAEFSPTTLYKDYAIDESLFHWESQNDTGETTATGRRYQEHEAQGSQVLLCVREAKKGPIGTAPYLCLGTVRYRSHTGERPMQILWELDRPMPSELLLKARLAG